MPHRSVLSAARPPTPKGSLPVADRGVSTGKTSLPVSSKRRNVALGIAALADISTNLASAFGGRRGQGRALETVLGFEEQQLEREQEERKEERAERIEQRQLLALAANMNAQQVTTFGQLIEQARKVGDQIQDPAQAEAAVAPLVQLAQQNNLPFTKEFARAIAQNPQLGTKLVKTFSLLSDAPRSETFLPVVNALVKKGDIKGAEEFLRRHSNLQATREVGQILPGIVQAMQQELGGKPIPLTAIANVIRATNPQKGEALADFILGVDVPKEIHERFIASLPTLVQRPGFAREVAEGVTKKEAEIPAAVERAKRIQEATLPGKVQIAQETGLAAAQLKQQLPIEPSPGERKSIAERGAALSELNRLNKLFDPNMVGPIQGRLLGIKASTGFRLTDREANFIALTRSVQNRVIKEITGAQLSEAEADRIIGQIPVETDPPKLWRAKFEQTKRNLQELQRKQREVLRQPTRSKPSGIKPSGPPKIKSIKRID